MHILWFFLKRSYTVNLMSTRLAGGEQSKQFMIVQDQVLCTYKIIFFNSCTVHSLFIIIYSYCTSANQADLSKYESILSTTLWPDSRQFPSYVDSVHRGALCFSCYKVYALMKHHFYVNISRWFFQSLLCYSAQSNVH